MLSSWFNWLVWPIFKTFGAARTTHDHPNSVHAITDHTQKDIRALLKLKKTKTKILIGDVPIQCLMLVLNQHKQALKKYDRCWNDSVLIGTCRTTFRDENIANGLLI